MAEPPRATDSDTGSKESRAVDKKQKRAVAIDVMIPADSSIRKKEHEKVEKCQGLKEQLKQTWKVKADVVPVVVGALRAVTPPPNWESGSSRFQERHLKPQSRRAQS